jgi:hypothetical protein
MRPTWTAEFFDALKLDLAARDRQYAQAGVDAAFRYFAEHPPVPSAAGPNGAPAAAEIAAAVASAVTAALAAVPAKSRRRTVIRDVDGEITAVVDEEIQP